METKITAVEWLVEKLREQKFVTESQIFIAKKMEKEQIIDAVDGFPLENRHLDGEQYYNETYGK